MSCFSALQDSGKKEDRQTDRHTKREPNLELTLGHQSASSCLQTGQVFTLGCEVGENSSVYPGTAVCAVNNCRLRLHKDDLPEITRCLQFYVLSLNSLSRRAQQSDELGARLFQVNKCPSKPNQFTQCRLNPLLLVNLFISCVSNAPCRPERQAN